MDSLERFLHAVPKVELHCHLLGSVREATFRELVRAAGAQALRSPGPGAGPDAPPEAARARWQAGASLTDAEVTAFYTRGDKPVGVLRVLRALDRWLIRSPDDLYRIAYEHLADAAAHQVRWAELSWNPTGTARESGIPYPAALAGLRRAFADAEHDHGIRGRLIAAIDREASPEDAVEMVRWVVEHRADEVLGIGIDYRETDRPPELFAAAYALARRHGLKATAHAGEFGLPWTNVRSAVELLKVDRIDHGYTVVDEPAFAADCARWGEERGLVFTVVPTNSYYLRTLDPPRWALDHPIRRMPGLGLRVHPNTDDPTLHHVTPTGAWAMMVRDFGFSIDALRGFLVNGLDAAWIDDGTRRAWKADHLAAFDRLRATHGL